MNSRLDKLLLGIAVCAVFLFSAWAQSGGHFMAPLDDTLIHLNYAQRLSQGHFFVYSPGAGYSSGATSWLWAFVLTPLVWVSGGGVKALVLAVGVCCLLLLFSALVLGRLTQDALAAPGLAFLMATLFLLNGHVVWAYLSGMETGLFCALILLALAGWRAWTEDESRTGRRVFLVALALLPLTRPEGWALWAAAMFLAVVRGVQMPLIGARDAVGVGLAALPGFAAALTHRWNAGEWTTNGMILKGLWGQSGLSLFDKFEILARNLVSVFAHFYNNLQPDPLQAEWRGQWVRPFAPPLAWVLAVVGGGMGLVSEWRRGRLGVISLATLWWGAGILTVAMAALPFVHNQRYLAPWTPLMLLLAGAGLARVARLFDPNERHFVWGVGLFWLALSFGGTLWWAGEYGRNAADIFHQHRRMSWIVAEETPPEDRIAITDAGVLAYYGRNPMLDLVGLCAPAAQARAFHDGEGSVFERLASLPEDQRPRWFVTYPAWWSQNFPLGEARATAWLASTTITSGTDLTLYRFDPAVLDSGRLPSRYLPEEGGMYLPATEPAPGDAADRLEVRLRDEFWEIVDSLNVADRECEAAHDYRREDLPGYRPADPMAWPRPWNRVGVGFADLPAPLPDAPYAEIREAVWERVRDVPVQEHLFATYLDHGAAWATTGTLAASPPAAPALEALRHLDTVTTPTFADLLEVLPPEAPALPFVYDGGRAIGRTEAFALTIHPDQPALLLWRVDTPHALTLHVEMDGQRLEPWVVEPGEEGRWREAWLRLPPREAASASSSDATPRSPTARPAGAGGARGASVSDRVRFRVTFEPPGLPGTAAPLSARWWLLQPAAH